METTDEFKGLKRRDREVLRVEELTEGELVAIAMSRLPFSLYR